MKPQMKMEPDPLSREALQALDDLNGAVHAGFRPVHAKGVLLSGTFTPAASAATLTNAPHVLRPATRIAVRFSNFAGVPTVADNDGENAGPRGLAIRFYLEEHVHTDIVAHSVDGFPASTAEEFVELLHAIKASGPDAVRPTPIEVFLGSHPAALAFVQAPKPIPTSFARESFYAVNAYKFTNAAGASKFGRYRVVPAEGSEYLEPAEAAKKGPNFLFEEMTGRIAQGGFKMRILVQVATEGDVVNDSTVRWPDERPVVEFGAIEVSGIAADDAAEQRKIIFDPIPRVAGIETSGDPLQAPRAALYLVSGRRRRSSGE